MSQEEMLKHGRRAYLMSLALQHAWATMLIGAVIKGSTSPAIPDMFSGIMVGIFANLAIIVGDKTVMLAVDAWVKIKAGKA